MSAPVFHELDAPDDALAFGGQEVLRAAVVDDDLHVSLANVFDQPEVWGVMLADIARHIADMYARHAGLDRADALARVRASLDQEWPAGDAPVAAKSPPGP